MFHAVRIKSLWLMVFLLIGVLFFVAICLIALRAGSPDTLSMNGEKVDLRVETQEDMKEFLSACGYGTTELVYDHEITVPKHWNDTYTAYNDLQREQGFDLTPYKGKAAEERIYSDGERCITLLICEGKIIAAHLSESDGTDMRALFDNT